MNQRTELTGILKTKEGKQYFSSAIYPTLEENPNDIYVVTTMMDRLDLIADEYYGKPSYWIIIALANDGIGNGTLYVPAGVQLRIPFDPSQFDIEYNELNLT